MQHAHPPHRTALALHSNRPAKLRHTRCTSLTLLLNRPGWDTALISHAHAHAFLQRLTHLRVPDAQRVPCGLPRLTHLSYRELGRRGTEKVGEGEGAGVEWAQEGFPDLREVVVTSSAWAGAGEGVRARRAEQGWEHGVVVRRVCVAGVYRTAHVVRGGCGWGGWERGVGSCVGGVLGPSLYSDAALASWTMD